MSALDDKIEFEAKMESLAAQLSFDGRKLAGEVLKLELRSRFGERGSLPEEFAAKAIRLVQGVGGGA